MSLLLGILKAFVVLEIILLITCFFLLLILFVEIWREIGTTKLLLSPPDAKEIKELVKDWKITAAMDTLWGCTWWWLNGPMFLYLRFVKKHKNSTFLDPRGKTK